MQEREDDEECCGSGCRSCLDIVRNLRHSADDVSAKANYYMHSFWGGTVALCCCMFVATYLLISPFPYSGFMSMDLIDNLTTENVGTYAGLLSASLMFGRALAAYQWGKIADRYGRRFALIASLANASLLSLAFGFSPTYRWALISRFLIGMANGLTVVIKTAITELAHGDDDLERMGVGLVVTMWGYGMLISPAISGMLSRPEVQYPDLQWINGKFERLLTTFPFILPNMMGSCLCLTSLILVLLCVDETLAREDQRSLRHVFADCWNWFMQPKHKLAEIIQGSGESSEPASATSKHAGRTLQRVEEHEGIPSIDVLDKVITIRRDSLVDDLTPTIKDRRVCERSALLPSTSSPESYFSAAIQSASAQQFSNQDAVEVESSETDSTTSATVSALLARKHVRQHLIAMWIFSFGAVCIDEAFPLFCIAEVGGLGLQERQIGWIMSGSGIIFVVCQYFAFAVCMKKFGLYKSLNIGICLSSFPVILIPLSILTNRGAPQGDMNWLTFIFLSTVLATAKIFGGIFYAGITIGINRAVKAPTRATLNGLATLGGSTFRAAGPVFAGYLVSFSFSFSSGVSHKYGSIIIFSVICVISFVAVIWTFSLSQKRNGPEKGGERSKTSMEYS